MIFFRSRAAERDEDLAGPRAPDRDVSRGSSGRRRVFPRRAGRRVASRGRDEGERLRRSLEERVGRRGRAARLPRRRRAARSHRRRPELLDSLAPADRRDSAGGGWPDAPDQPLDPSLLQRARGPRRDRVRRGDRARDHRRSTSSRLSRSRGSNTELSSRIGARRRGSRAATAEAARRSAVDQQGRARRSSSPPRRKPTASSISARFPGREFFNEIESTLPPDVMLSSVRPTVEDGTTQVTMGVLGGGPRTSTSSWRSSRRPARSRTCYPPQRDRTDEGLHRVVVESIYTGVAPTSPAPRQPPRGRRRAGREAAGSERCAGDARRRVFREKRALIWPIAIALILNVVLYAIVVYPLVEEGRRTAKRRPPPRRTARRRAARLQRRPAPPSPGRPRRTSSCRSSTAKCCRPT